MPSHADAGGDLPRAARLAEGAAAARARGGRVAGSRRARAPADRGGGDLRHPARRREPGGGDLRGRAVARSGAHRPRRQAGGESAFAAASGRSLLPLAERLVGRYWRPCLGGRRASRPRSGRGSGISWRAPPRRPATSRARWRPTPRRSAAVPEGPRTLAPAARSGGADVPAGVMAGGGGGPRGAAGRPREPSSNARRRSPRWSGSASRTCARASRRKAIAAARKGAGAGAAPPRACSRRWSRRRRRRATTTPSSGTRRRCCRSPRIAKTKRELLEHVADDPSRAAQGSAAGDRGLHGGAGDLARRAVDHAPPAGAAERDPAVEAVGRAADQAGRADRDRSTARRITSPRATSWPRRWAPSGEAVDVYERALDADPNDLKTFERIDTLVTAHARLEDAGADLPAADQAHGERTCRPRSARRCWRSGTGWARSTGRGSRTTRRRSPRSRSRPGSIPNRTSGAGSSPSSTA